MLVFAQQGGPGWTVIRGGAGFHGLYPGAETVPVQG